MSIDVHAYVTRLVEHPRFCALLGARGTLFPVLRLQRPVSTHVRPLLPRFVQRWRTERVGLREDLAAVGLGTLYFTGAEIRARDIHSQCKFSINTTFIGARSWGVSGITQ